jgi:hypothetical protein
VRNHIANGGRRTKTGVILMLVLFAAGFVATAWPTAAQEVRYRPRSLVERLFNSDDERQPRVERRRRVVQRPRAVRQPPAERKGLFGRLFGGEVEEQPLEPTRKVRTKAKSKSRKSGAGAGQVVRVEEPDALPKLDTARTVLVIGDFMAGGLSEGLVSAYSQNPNIRIIERTNGSSGFVRDDFYNWPQEIRTLIEAEKPAAVVVMLGANDRQQMKLGTTREAPLSDNWVKEYQLRVDALAAVIKERSLPFVWVGLPAFKSAKVSSDLLTFNDMYRKSTENAGGSFVDIWDGFVDENGAFVMNGPDMNGQPVRLRGSDGISLSKPGKRKVAFYVEKPLNKLLGNETVPATGLPGAAMVGPVAPAGIYVDRTQPMAIDDPELDGGQALLGETTERKVEKRTAAERLVVEGIAPAAAPGRADDFGGAATPVAMPAAPPATAAPSAASPVEPAAAAGAASPEATTAISR